MKSRAYRTVFIFCLFCVSGGQLFGQTAPRIYLALGDSVVFGFIANAGNAYGNPENFIGYPDYVGQTLNMRDFDAGCPGETSGSFLSASAPDDGCKAFKFLAPLHLNYSSTQGQYARAFVKNRPETRLVTLMLGANDLFLSQQNCANDPACIAAGLPGVLDGVGTNVATILGQIRSSGYRGIIVVVNYYSTDYSDAFYTQIIQQLNQTLAAAAQAEGAVVADVFTAFQIVASNPLAPGKTCNAGLLNASAQDQFTCDVHPSQSGQKLIAKTVVAAFRGAGRKATE
jgi:lysophospholipase L1-like esterase